MTAEERERGGGGGGGERERETERDRERWRELVADTVMPPMSRLNHGICKSFFVIYHNMSFPPVVFYYVMTSAWYGWPT